MTSRPALQVGSIGRTYITKGHEINVCPVHFSDNGESVNSSYLYCNNSFNWGMLRFMMAILKNGNVYSVSLLFITPREQLPQW